MLLLRANSYQLKKRTLKKKKEREEKRKQKPRWTLSERRGEKEDGKDRERETRKEQDSIEKEMKKRLFWGAVGCETGPFTLN